jgi:acyl-homoserine-lactone acylase
MHALSSRTRPGLLCALAAALLAPLLLSHVRAAPDSAAHQPPAGAEILWDEWGTPHIFADDVESLFRAFGWAQMHSHGNLLLRLLAQARGVAAEYGGQDFVPSDRAVRVMGMHDVGRNWYVAQTPAFRANVDAFAAGVNEYAAAHPEALKDTFKPVLPVTGIDVMAHVARDMFLFVAGAGGCEAALPGGGLYEAFPFGSNAWAIGPSRSQSGNALLLANPHLAWSGEQTFYEAQLVAPGYDVYGTTLVGIPVIAIGFNENLGWTHTVNTIDACDLYELTVTADGYLLDGEERAFDSRTDTLRVRAADGTVSEQALPLRRSVHGPVVEKDGQTLAIRIASVGQTLTAGLVEQWWEMGRARTLGEFQAALRRNQLPMFNVIYADRDQHVMAVFAGQVPLRPASHTGSWLGVVPGDSAATLWSDVHPFDDLPQVTDPPGGFVQNSNSPPWSYTLPLVPALDPDAFPPYVSPRFIGWRERRGLRMLLEHPALGLEEMARLKYSTHFELADAVLPELLAAARASGNGMARQAADVLAAWDRQAEPESRGVLLFLAWVVALNPSDQGTLSDVFRVPSDPADPLHTPRGLADPGAAVQALEAAAMQVQALYGRLDVPWGEVGRLARGAIDLPANGFLGDPFGVFRVLFFPPPHLLMGGPAPAVGGDTFIAAVEFSTPLRARVLMTYGNSTQPDSPHFGDQLPLSARGELRPAWRTRAEIEAHLAMRTVIR